MLYASLILNIVVLIPVCFLMLTQNKRAVHLMGPFTPSQGILNAMYLAILIASIGLLFHPDIKYVIALLSIQIIYKVLTPFTVKTLKHPFVISNLLIAVFHSVTVYTLYQSS